MKIKDHLTLQSFSLQHPDLEAFVSCKCKASGPYLVWRIFWAIYHSSWLAGNLVITALQEEASVAKWFIYLSNWVYLILTVECVLEAVVVKIAWSKKSDDNRATGLPWYIQMMWLLYTVSVDGAIMVSAWYWTFIHKGRQFTAIRVNTHAIAAFYVIVNMAITRLPLRLLHFLYPVVFGVTYTLFSAIYCSLGGTNQNGDPFIYSILDWSKINRALTITSLSNFVFIPLAHVLMWTLSLIFQKIYDRCTRRNTAAYRQAIDSADCLSVDIS